MVETYIPDCGHVGVWVVEEPFSRWGFHQVQRRSIQSRKSQGSQPILRKFLQRLLARRQQRDWTERRAVRASLRAAVDHRRSVSHAPDRLHSSKPAET